MKKFFSLSISIFILGAISASAFMIVINGVFSETSNINLLKDYLAEEETAKNQTMAISNKAIPTTSTPLSADVISIVDLLRERGLESSLEYRARLAETLGMSNYVGTAEQNEELMEILRINQDFQSIKGSQ